MKKIWVWIKTDNRWVMIIMLGTVLLNIILNSIVLHRVNGLAGKTPVEEYSIRTIDSLRGVNSVLELELNRIDSIRNEAKYKISNLNDTASVALFWELLSNK